MSSKHQNVVLCASARLAHHLRQQYQTSQTNKGEQQWVSPNITTLSAWLDETISHAILMGNIDIATAPLGMLNNTQEGLLWEQSIQQCLADEDAAALFNTSGLASAAMEANRYLIEWNISLDIDAATEETKQFLQWRKVFQAKCKQNQYLEPVRYMAWQLSQLATVPLALPQTVTLAGFDRINPHLAQLSEILERQQVAVTQWQCAEATQQTTLQACTEQIDECRLAVAWAKQSLQQNPDAKLAIVVPELEQLRPTLLNLLDDTFHPESLLPALTEQARIYECSLGLPLTDWPIIETALDVLRIAFVPSKQAQTLYSKLLLDPFWSANIREADARAQLDAKMRSHLALNINIFSFQKWLIRLQEAEHPILSPLLNQDLMQLIQRVEQAPKRQSPSAWAHYFEETLAETHWQGERQLSSVEFQTVERFKRTLKEMHSLDQWLDKISASEALQRLTRLCREQVFQPETTTQPQIFVMGMLETAAQQMDGMWVMGMNDHAWPPLSRTNALIPAELQRHAAVPNASSEIQTEFAKSIHARLLASAKQVCFSYAEKDGEKLLRPSPLVQAIPLSANTLTPVRTLAESLYKENAPNSWEWLDDQQAPAVLSGEHVSGGTGLLKAQNICPAWAFFQYRLKARALDVPKEGLDAMERGSLIHEVLARYWTAHDGLHTDANPLKKALDKIAESVLSEFNQTHHDRFSATFLMLENERLSKLAMVWLLEVDAKRPMHFTVTACEQEEKTEIEGIQIKLVIDRIDTLEDGRLVVIDYKTSSTLDYKNWAQSQLTEPQLPIYAAFLLKDADIAAVCFGQVRIDSQKFIGVSASEGLVQDTEVFNIGKRGKRTFDDATFPNWSSIITHWKDSITDTARALKKGDAAIIFDQEKDLQYCDVLPLLRLPERQLQFERKQQAN